MTERRSIQIIVKAAPGSNGYTNPAATGVYDTIQYAIDVEPGDTKAEIAVKAVVAVAAALSVAPST